MKTDWNANIHTTVKGWGGVGTVDVMTTTTNKNMHQFQSTFTNSIRVWKDLSYYTPYGPYKWGARPEAGSQMAAAATAYHQFPCSKCHTPHANSVKRLMVTNCLDVGTSSTQRKAHGTDAAWNFPTWAAGTWAGGSPPVTNITDLAMHCHNKRKTNTTGGGGWNKVTGW